MKLKLLLVFFLIINASLAADNVCKYKPGQTIFRCDDVLPNLVLTPGSEGEVTVNCCFTGDIFDNNVSYDVLVKVVSNHSFRKQYVYPNGTAWYIHNVTVYHASDWITGIDAPSTAKGFTPFPVTIHFKMPSSNPLFFPGALFRARVDVLMNIPGALTPNIPILPNIIIPSDWTPVDLFKPIIIGSLLLLAGIIIFKKIKFTKIHKKHVKSKKNNGGGEDFD